MMHRTFAFAFAALCLISTEAFAGVLHWDVLPEKSSIEWSVTYGGKPITGSFPTFTADIGFDPGVLDASHAEVKVDMTKVKSPDKDAQDSLPGYDWFAVNQYPLATFAIGHFAHVAGDRYIAEGDLTIRDKTQKLSLPFTVQFFDDKDANPPVRYARMSGETVIKRTQFGVGRGDWAQTDSIPDDVKVTIRLEAKQAP